MNAVVHTSLGTIVGKHYSGYDRFLGIPYAKPPIGQRRFRLPESVEPWREPYLASEFGPTCPGMPGSVPELFVHIPGENWLNLNIWRPCHSSHSSDNGYGDVYNDINNDIYNNINNDIYNNINNDINNDINDDITPETGCRCAGSYPVLVWFHGGAFTSGSNSVPLYDGQSFARDGIIFVSCNYRLGVEGYATFPDAPHNRGLADQIAALQWISNNIAAFGGNPQEVTIWGQSAGGISVLALLSCSDASGLYQRAIVESGVPHEVSVSDRKKYLVKLAKHLDVDPSAQGFSQLDPYDIAATIADIRNNEPGLGSIMPFGPVIDGVILTRSWHEILADSSSLGTSVPLLIGTAADEFRYWAVTSDKFSYQIDWDSFCAAVSALGFSPDIADKYREFYQDAISAQDAIYQLLADVIFVAPSYFFAVDYPGTAYAYAYDWASDDTDFGACHCADLAFVFHNLYSAAAQVFIGKNPPPELADEMHSAWVRFVQAGSPGWPSIHEGGVHLFSVDRHPVGDEHKQAVVHRELLDLWRDFSS